jgi:membrane protein implicated in regulation of membrane protease activity
MIWGIALLAFFHVLVNPQSGYLVDTAAVPTATTYGLLAFFSVVSVSLWWWFRREGQRPTRAPEPTVEEQQG